MSCQIKPARRLINERGYNMIVFEFKYDKNKS